jgi:hypothetical protein
MDIAKQHLRMLQQVQQEAETQNADKSNAADELFN